ncbi:hypothetical protein TrRE_jg12524 [Triparma retinervis]|uniref:Uncharacterized protein n=1 Tax=Triparma retinervis TaxID=2557542 RepID=A0A9W6ZHI9_9STRA|nr:hypothetical protein TrRE_jg12524 [Triparma retinervis]
MNELVDSVSMIDSSIEPVEPPVEGVNEEIVLPADEGVSAISVEQQPPHPTVTDGETTPPTSEEVPAVGDPPIPETSFDNSIRSSTVEEGGDLVVPPSHLAEGLTSQEVGGREAAGSQVEAGEGPSTGHVEKGESKEPDAKGAGFTITAASPREGGTPTSSSPPKLDTLNIKVGSYPYEVTPSIFLRVPDGLLARIFAPSKTALLRSTKLNLERERGDLFRHVISWYRDGDLDEEWLRGEEGEEGVEALKEEAKFFGVYAEMFPKFKRTTKAAEVGQVEKGPEGVGEAGEVGEEGMGEHNVPLGMKQIGRKQSLRRKIMKDEVQEIDNVKSDIVQNDHQDNHQGDHQDDHQDDHHRVIHRLDLGEEMSEEDANHKKWLNSEKERKNRIRIERGDKPLTPVEEEREKLATAEEGKRAKKKSPRAHKEGKGGRGGKKGQRGEQNATSPTKKPSPPKRKSPRKEPSPRAEVVPTEAAAAPVAPPKPSTKKMRSPRSAVLKTSEAAEKTKPTITNTVVIPKPQDQKPEVYNFVRPLLLPISPSRPYTITLSPRASLRLLTVRGEGRLIMSAGNLKEKRVVCDKGVLFDSSTEMFKGQGERTKLLKDLPGGHMYEFVVEGGSLEIQAEKMYTFEEHEKVEEGEGEEVGVGIKLPRIEAARSSYNMLLSSSSITTLNTNHTTDLNINLSIIISTRPNTSSTRRNTSSTRLNTSSTRRNTTTLLSTRPITRLRTMVSP